MVPHHLTCATCIVLALTNPTCLVDSFVIASSAIRLNKPIQKVRASSPRTAYTQLCLSSASLSSPTTKNENGVSPPPQPYPSLSSIVEGAEEFVEKTVVSLFNLDMTAEELEGSYLVHQGATTPVIVRAPSIGSFTLAKGWSEESLKSFTATVNDVVLKNPILTGRVVSVNCGLRGSEIRVVPGEFIPDVTHSFVDVVDAREKMPSPMGLDQKGYLSYLDEQCQPLVEDPCSPALTQIENHQALFQVKVILLPDDYACIFIGMSHILGDIVTYTGVLEQLSSLHDAHKPRPINWNNAKQATHQISAENFSAKDTHIMYGPPFIVGICASLLGKPSRVDEYLALSKEKINAKRHELCADENESLSSNDIITAALSEANGSSDIFAFTRTMRQVHPKEYKDMGGNLYVEIPFSRKAGSDPNEFRRISKKGYHYEKDQLPLMPFLAGRVGRITNCVTPMSVHLSFGNTETVCQAPPKAFLDATPFDNAVIFTMDREHFGVMHNFLEIDKSGLLGEIMA